MKRIIVDLATSSTEAEILNAFNSSLELNPIVRTWDGLLDALWRAVQGHSPMTNGLAPSDIEIRYINSADPAIEKIFDCLTTHRQILLEYLERDFAVGEDVFMRILQVKPITFLNLNGMLPDNPDPEYFTLFFAKEAKDNYRFVRDKAGHTYCTETYYGERGNPPFVKLIDA